MVIFMYLLTLSYFLLNIWLIWGWLKGDSFNFLSEYKTDDPITLPQLSVIIPVRNEANNILDLLKDLQKQSLPASYFEVIIIDDHSNDDTFDLVNQFIKQAKYDLQIIPLMEDTPRSPKKSAISQALQIARGKLMVHTDGDCRVQRHWLALIYQLYQDRQAKFISAAVTFEPERSLFESLLSVEFASLVGTGAACMNLGFPNMCNGANLAYPKSVFQEVEGYQGVDQIASGDDEFLLHKIARKYPEEVYFLKNSQATVYTQAPENLEAFYRQRKRWASKWKYYQDFRVKLLAFFIFLVHFGLLFATIGVILNIYPYWPWMLQLGLKFLGEWIFLGIVLRFLKKLKHFFFIPIIQLIYPFYIVFFGLIAQSNTYEWKGRKLK